MSALLRSGIAAVFVICTTHTFAEDTPATIPAAPKPCQLGEAASLDVKTGTEGMIFLDGTLDGRRGDFLVDSGGMGLVLTISTAASLNLSPQRAFLGGSFVGGTKLEFGVTAKRLQMGNTAIIRPWFLIAPDRVFPSNAIGNVQPHALWPNYDLEIDFAKGKLNVFLSNQCPGHVVYWTHEPYAAVPMKLDIDGHITVQAMLDGKPVDAMIDTGAQNSFISMRASSHILDVDEDSKGLQNLGSVVINNDVVAKRYRFPFQSLTIEGIVIQRPKIEIADTGADSRKDPLVLGIGVLRQLHLFIAYDENKLYLTSAEAR